ncbi:hypothetical protein CPC08DRAFT_797270, partial [Agrocybe pediades]
RRNHRVQASTSSPHLNHHTLRSHPTSYSHYLLLLQILSHRTNMNFFNMLHDSREFAGVHRRNPLIESSRRFDPHLRKDTRTVNFLTEHQIQTHFGGGEIECQHQPTPGVICGQLLTDYESAARHIERAHGIRRARNGTQKIVCKWAGCGSTVTASSHHRHTMTHIGAHKCPVRWCTFENVRRDVLASHMRQRHLRRLDPHYRCGVIREQ